MKSYFLIAGIAGIIYYVTLLVYSGRMRSTFSGFWLGFGGVHLLMGCAPFSVSTYQMFAGVVLFMWGVFVLVEIPIVVHMKGDKQQQADILLVLGAQVRGKTLSRSLRLRLDRTIAYFKIHPSVRKIIVSGGQGKDEAITEADAMAFYLIENGIEEQMIQKENKSVSTRENFRFSRPFLNPDCDRVGIVTNDFHICRSCLLAKQEGYKNVFGIPAPSDPIYQLNYLVREFFAVLSVLLYKKCIQNRGR